MSDTVFTKVDYQLGTLISQIELGEIGLPDLQRPFVWAPVKVRDLFDSMYRGYPVGHLLFWSSGAEPGAKQIGTEKKQLAPRLLIVDGQQRLTSLFAVMKQQPVIGKDYVRKRIQIAFRPGDGTFAVADAATAKKPRVHAGHRRDVVSASIRGHQRVPRAAAGRRTARFRPRATGRRGAAAARGLARVPLHGARARSRRGGIAGR